MKLTTKGRYAVTAMLDLAIHYKDDVPITLSEISQRQNISLSYLEQLFARLRKHGLIESTRGPGGGYRLAHPANAISIGQVINAVDEKVDATRCGGHGNCQDDDLCLTHALWMNLSEQIFQFLQKITLGELVQNHEVQMVNLRLEGRVPLPFCQRNRHSPPVAKDIPQIEDER